MTWERAPHQPITDKPWWVRLNSARAAVCVAPNNEHYKHLPLSRRMQGSWPCTTHRDFLDYGLRNVGNWIGFWWVVVVTYALEVPFELLFKPANRIYYIEFYEALDESWSDVIAKERGWFALIDLHLWLFGLSHRIECFFEEMRQICQSEGLWVNQIRKISAGSRTMQCVEVTV